MSEEDKAFADLELSAYPVEWSTCIVDATTDGSCGEVELESITENYLETVRRLKSEGYPSEMLETHLRDAANDMEGYCPVCVSQLDRERETFE